MKDNHSAMKKSDNRRKEKEGKLEKVDKFVARLKRQAAQKAKAEVSVA